MLPTENIQKYGGKAAILNHIKEKLPDMPIPKYVVKSVGEDISSVMDAADSMTAPLIVRSSSPHEYGDFEGIFESKRDVDGKPALERAIRDVEVSADTERAKQYAQQNGFDIDEKMAVIVQEQSPSKYCGAMMRHPNNPDVIFIDCFSGRGKLSQNYSTMTFNERTQKEQGGRFFFSDGINMEDTQFLVEQYNKIESLTDIAEGYSLFIEFGFKPFALYQARPFKPIETADFDIPEARIKEDLWSDFVFGITPPEGIVLPGFRSMGWSDAFVLGKMILSGDGNKIPEFNGIDQMFMMELHELGYMEQLGMGSRIEKAVTNKMQEWSGTAETMLKGNPYCLLMSSAQREKYDVDLVVPNMKALVTGGIEHFLVHNMMRLIKKADITVGYSNILHSDFYRQFESLEDQVRIISNGKEAVVIKVPDSEKISVPIDDNRAPLEEMFPNKDHLRYANMILDACNDSPKMQSDLIHIDPEYKINLSTVQNDIMGQLTTEGYLSQKRTKSQHRGLAGEMEFKSKVTSS